LGLCVGSAGEAKRHFESITRWVRLPEVTRNRGEPEMNNKKQGTFRELLSQRAGFSSFLDLLNTEISFTKPGEYPGDKKTSLDAISGVVDDALAEAYQQAESQGRPVEEVLDDMGFELNEDSAGGSTEDFKEDMLRSLHWEMDKPGEEPRKVSDVDAEKRWSIPEGELLERFRTEIGPIAEEKLRRALAGIKTEKHPFVFRLRALGMLTDTRIDRIKRQSKLARQPLWKLILNEGPIEPGLFAQILACDPIFPVTHRTRGDFEEYLLTELNISYTKFRALQEKAQDSGRPLTREFLDHGILDLKRYMELFANFMGLTDLSLSAADQPDSELLELMPSFFFDLFQILPYRKTENELTLISPRPVQPFIRTTLERYISKVTLTFALVSPVDFDEFAEKIGDKYPASRHKETVTLPAAARERVPLDRDKLRAAISSASTVNLVRMIFEGALEARATDIHLDPRGSNAAIRYRIDGICYDVTLLPNDLFGEIIARIKILADLNITEHRRPQDGHIKIRIEDRDFNFRISTVPTKGGEKVGVRIVDPTKILTSLNLLGFEKNDLAKVREFTKRPHGMVLATGPVGSGKTTTLYSSIDEMNNPSVNIMSIEDPVEFELPAVNQVEVNYQLQFGFLEGLRALLRHDPDAILVGEIRDEETARIAVRASMTGLLVFSSLHTNDAPGAVTTLFNFHIPPHLIASSMVGVIAQRLLRKICPYCKTAITPNGEQIARVQHVLQQDVPNLRLYRGKGCSHCFHSGYLGRMGVFEIFDITQPLKDMILDNATERQLRDYALAHGMFSLAQDSIKKAMRGDTTLAECSRVLGF
jgi:type IV pilus assembly protein PilB